jgi:hypothetical protein
MPTRAVCPVSSFRLSPIVNARRQVVHELHDVLLTNCIRLIGQPNTVRLY